MQLHILVFCLYVACACTSINVQPGMCKAIYDWCQVKTNKQTRNIKPMVTPPNAVSCRCGQKRHKQTCIKAFAPLLVLILWASKTQILCRMLIFYWSVTRDKAKQSSSFSQINHYWFQFMVSNWIEIFCITLAVVFSYIYLCCFILNTFKVYLKHT